MATPLVAHFSGATAVAEHAVDPVFTLLDGLGELRLTEFALTQLAKEGIAVQAVAPATAITGADGNTVEGIRLTPEYGTAAISLTGRPDKGNGRLQGGVVLHDSTTRMEIAQIRGSVPDGLVFAFLKVDDEWVGELPLYAADPGAVRLSVQPGAPGQPTTLKGSGIPMTPTQEGVDAFANAFGVDLFTTEDTVFTAAGEGLAWPLPSLPFD